MVELLSCCLPIYFGSFLRSLQIFGIYQIFFIGELIDVDIVVIFSISYQAFYSIVRIFEIIGKRLASSVGVHF